MEKVSETPQSFYFFEEALMKLKPNPAIIGVRSNSFVSRQPQKKKHNADDNTFLRHRAMNDFFSPHFSFMSRRVSCERAKNNE
jgi:hypothetical protein